MLQQVLCRIFVYVVLVFFFVVGKYLCVSVDGWLVGWVGIVGIGFSQNDKAYNQRS